MFWVHHILSVDMRSVSFFKIQSTLNLPFSLKNTKITVSVRNCLTKLAGVRPNTKIDLPIRTSSKNPEHGRHPMKNVVL